MAQNNTFFALKQMEDSSNNDKRNKNNYSKLTLFLKRTSILFILLIVLLTAIGIAPQGVKEINNVFFSMFIKDESSSVIVEENTNRSGEYREPTRILIPSLGADVEVLNPVSRDTETLDKALLKGAVRYPGSGDLNSKNTMVIFGHSSYLPVVHNKAFQSFNNIQKLNEGDSIILEASGVKFRYLVDRVELVNADDGFVDLSEQNRKLVLATCNSFGKKQERFVVTAYFDGNIN